MYHFGEKSRAKYMEIDGRLQDILDCAIHIFDFSILEGFRDKKTQNKYYKKGTSQLKWDKSKHNQNPSRAIDICPYPIRWPDKDKQTTQEYAECLGRFYFLAGIILAIAHMKNIKIIWGGNWKSKDLVHFELEE